MIENGSRVSLEYTLTLDDGTVVDSNVGRDPLVYEQGGGQILPALERELTNLNVNDTKKVTLSAEDGYGVVDPEARQAVARDVVPEEGRHAGAVLQATDSNGQTRFVRVHEVRDSEIVLDFNHQLAGQQLNFDVRILAIN